MVFSALVRRLGLVLPVLVTGCFAGDAPEEPVAPCDVPTTPPALSRLSRAEYVRTVRAVLDPTLPDDVFRDLPFEPNVGGFSNGAGALNDEVLHVDRYYDVAERIATRIDVAAMTPEMVIDEYGERLFRRPLDDGERERLMAMSDPTDVLVTMLMSPGFSYHSSRADEWALASRLSYAITGGPPDAALLAAAASGRIDVEAQVRRLFATPAARDAMNRVVFEWLQLAALYDTWRDIEDFETEREVMVDEIEALVGRTVFDGPGTLEALLSESRDGRVGLLGTRAFLVRFARYDESNAVQRGKFIREQLLCQPINPASGVVAGMFRPVEGQVTTRKKYEMLVTEPACATCHRQMDSIGFAFEGFDHAGRPRTEDNGLPVDTTSTIVGAGDADGSFADAAALSAHLAKSEYVARCVARTMFRYTFRRFERPGDACYVDALGDEFVRKGGRFEDLFVSIATSDAFASEVAP